MSRVKLSEFRAKKLLFQVLQRDYTGVSIDLEDKSYPKIINKLSTKNLYVTKVDQAVKKRGKNGLVKINRTKKQVLTDLNNFSKRGFRYALVEPYVDHKNDSERYVALARTEDGVRLSHSKKGGVDVESDSSAVHHELLGSQGERLQPSAPGPDSKLTTLIYELFEKSHMTLLEINPLVVTDNGPVPLDAAVEVDSAGQFFVDGAWDKKDIRETNIHHESERVVEKLNSNSPASLSLKILNPNGSIFLLLSGGGASVVVADELFHHGHHRKIANYGEYSGNPSEEDTYIYTREILSLINASKARKKVLIIAGGVANFTDVAKTFSGIIRAMKDASADIKKQKVYIFVRRGGPNQAKGLEAIKNFLEELGVNNFVYGPELSLADVVRQAAKVAA